MQFTDAPGFVGTLIAAIVAGGLIGFEREWRGRAAGFRTHILVCLASALLMEAAVMQGTWRFEPLPGTEIVSDPTRMAHGVLTGIGFLCAGVIFRSGFSIHGLTTAASLWITAAIGILFGAGLYVLGAIGTVLTVVVLVVLRLVSLRLPEASVIDLWVAWRRNGADAEAQVEAALGSCPRTERSDRYELIDDGEGIRRTYRLKPLGPQDVKALARRLDAIDGLTGYGIDPRED